MKKTADRGPSVQSWLARTIFMAILLVTVLVVAAMTGFGFLHLRGVQRQAIETAGATLAAAVAEPLAAGDREAMLRALNWWSSAPEINVLAVYGADAALVAGIGNPAVPDARIFERLPFEAGERFDNAAGRLVLPIKHRGAAVGSLYVEMGAGAFTRQLAVLSAIVAGLAGLALLALWIWLNRIGARIAQPITEFVAVAREVYRSPDNPKRAVVTGPKEITDLARTFNRMLDALQRNAARLDSDLQERARAEERLDRLAHYDAVTGLANRVHFQKELPRAAERARRLGSNIALVYLDLDDFKVVNDTLGHQVGDRLLKLVGERLIGVLRKGDFVCRLGGDEFTVILENIHSLGDAVDVVTKLIERLSESSQVGEHTLHVGVSAGIALLPEQTNDLSDLMRFADIAMYQAKGAGKNDYCIYTSDLAARANVRLAIEVALRKGIEQDEFFLLYQPQVDMLTGQIVGLEALIRWRHPERGVVAPGHFIEIAEQSGLIVPLGRQVIAKACRQWAVWRDGGVEPPRLAINVSGRQLDEENFADELIAELTALGRPLPRIELEITETLLMSDTRVSRSMLHRLAAAGIQWSLDDFGTGYSSLTYLSKFPISNIKIDRSFVSRLPGDGNSNAEAIVRAVLGMASGLGMSVVNEGVETREQADYLIAMGATIAQGYFFHRPMSGDDVLELLRRQIGASEDLAEPTL